ncbi:zinc finger protein 83-like [Malaya genurostris]|uniref:zinc finger protein 83-like n=1 Tax=Malaya genurostris TaxID=325434 RepID=UPI0026F3B8F0|nr:zinc finger protein 83-like [Malaya genurostris]
MENFTIIESCDNNDSNDPDDLTQECQFTDLETLSESMQQDSEASDIIKENIDEQKLANQSQVPSSNKNRKRHVKNQQNNEEQCAVCGKLVKTKMKHHMLRHSAPEGRPFRCEQCDKAYSFKRSLADHVRQVHKKIRHRCEVCEKEFVSRDVLRVHKKLHLNETYRCDICRQAFQQLMYLRKHMAMHEGKRFGCNICGKSFRFKQLMKQHMRVHTGEKPFQCNLCSKKFRTSSHLKQHHRTHTQAKVFQCKRCSDVAYACKKSLDRHIALEHPGL